PNGRGADRPVSRRTRCPAEPWWRQPFSAARVASRSVASGWLANCAPTDVSGKEPTAGLSGLTPQQLRIARHVAEGATNREVAQRPAGSTRTVDYHLRNVFAALGVRSRMELARMVDQEQR
ncbi:helix-turn-helix transcriptional regulator, partial [Streptomyces sp. NPDC006265]|uniref:helix-turn-helix domain-containing protein n=1 Tax=Streptomyces sp. NPDC006265 TaxID=3156740 RepID=UPI0033B935A5